MKKLAVFFFLLIMSHSSVFAQNCLNLSGKYKTSENIVYEILQKNCTRMLVTDPSGVMEITFNLGPQILSESPIIVDNVQVGVKKALLDSSLGLGEWFYQEKDILFYNDGSKQTIEKKICVVQKERNRDLFTNCYDYLTQSSHQYTDMWQ